MSLIALVHRANTTAADVLPTLNVSRWDTIMNATGINQSNVSSTAGPNWGTMLWNVGAVYTDALGPFVWVILFAIPFAMLWITQSDMVPAGILGFILGMYVAGFVGGTYLFAGIGFMVISAASVVWSLWQKRG